MFFRYCVFLFNGNVFITRIKENTVYKNIEELDLPEDINQDILKNELIYLTSPKARGKGINGIKCRLISIFKADENKAIQIISNHTEWKTRTIAYFYKKR